MINNDHTWRTLKISYLVSSRNEIMMGSFVGDTFSVLGCSVNQEGKTTLSTYVPQWRIKADKQYKIAAFISGFRTLDSTFSVNIATTNFDKNEGKVFIQIYTDARPPLEIIHLSYVVFPTVHDHFTFSILSNPTGEGTYELPGAVNFNRNLIDHDELKICKKGTVCPINEVQNPNGQC